MFESKVFLWNKSFEKSHFCYCYHFYQNWHCTYCTYCRTLIDVRYRMTNNIVCKRFQISVMETLRFHLKYNERVQQFLICLIFYLFVVLWISTWKSCAPRQRSCLAMLGHSEKIWNFVHQKSCHRRATPSGRRRLYCFSSDDLTKAFRCTASVIKAIPYGKGYAPGQVLVYCLTAVHVSV